MQVTEEIRQRLACPHTGQPLTYRSDAAAWLASNGFRPVDRLGPMAPRIADFEAIFLTADGMIAYPVQDGFPVLLWPEAYIKGESATVDLRDRKYVEAYSEMEYYNPVAVKNAQELPGTQLFAQFQNMHRKGQENRDSFPEPAPLWIESLYDSEAQIGVYRYLAPLRGKAFMQLGGDGQHAVRTLLAGAAEAVLVTPMIGEAHYAVALAKSVGVESRLSCIIGLGEELPFLEASIDAVYSPGCLHHMRMDIVMSELRRVLTVGGRFGAHEPWRSPLYAFGTALMGKREQGIFNRSQSVFCSPLTIASIAPVKAVFPRHVIRNHGILLRYPFLALQKLGVRPGVAWMIRIARFDDWLSRLLHLPRSWGGSIMLGGEKDA